MPRLARVVAKGYPHHVTQRGNYRQPVFEKDDDYVQYLEWLKDYGKKYSLNIWAYCLMTNHIHLICVPKKEDSLPRTLNMLHMRYAQYINRRKQAHGHLWQGRFYSCILDERHTYSAIRYVENNPVRAGIVRKPQRYRWSSASSHVDKKIDPVLSQDCYLEKEIEDWLEYLREKEDEQIIMNIRKCSMTGRPCGNDSFMKKFERLFGRRLRALPWGRPRKSIK
ncbi:MAG: transposase [Candidatus Scalinduaceae bacterium]